MWPVFRSSGSFFSWTANKSVWHRGLHNHVSNCTLNGLLGQSFCIDIFLNSILLFSYFPVPAPDKLGWSLLHWFEWTGVVWWTRRANLPDWKQYPLHTRHPWPCWCTVHSLPNCHFHIARLSVGLTLLLFLWIWVMDLSSICFYVFCILPEHFFSQHQQSRTKLENERLKKGVVFSGLDISSVVGKDQKVWWAINS